MSLLSRLDASARRADAAPAAPAVALIGFEIGGCALLGSMAEVAEVVSPPPLTRVPGVQPWLAGLANLRGRIVPIFDVARLFDLPVRTPLATRRVLIVEEGERAVGLLVDRLLGVHLPGQNGTPAGEQPQLALAGPFGPYAVHLHRRDGTALHEIRLRALLRAPGLRHPGSH